MLESDIAAETAEKEQTLEPSPEITVAQRILLFLSAHWRGLVIFFAPIICSFILFTHTPIQSSQWCAYCWMIMAVYWVTECIPLAVTSLFPIVMFPLTGVMDTNTTCKCYVNDSLFLFLGSLILATAIEQSGLHLRLALSMVQCLGFSHYRLLASVCTVTMFFSMWVTNTAATLMVVPIVSGLLKVFEEQGLMTMHDITDSENKVASDLATCYYCAIAFSATIGGIGSLVGTATNLALKGLFVDAYEKAPELLTFSYFSSFAIPYMILMEICCYFCLIFAFFGFLRPKSAAAQNARLSAAAIEAAKTRVKSEYNNLGKITFWEVMVIVLFSIAIILFFIRTPQLFHGWGESIREYFGRSGVFVRDTSAAFLIGVLMLLLPYKLEFFMNFKAKYYEDLPNKPIRSVVDWRSMNSILPYSFLFILGGGFAVATAGGPKHSDMNGEIGKMLSGVKDIPDFVIILLLILVTVFLTNFASNVVVANIIVPIAMQMANKTGYNPLWFNIVTGFSASYCFCLPFGTPGNLAVKSIANISTKKMIKAGIGPTITTILITWAAMYFWAPIIWTDIKSVPSWAS